MAGITQPLLVHFVRVLSQYSTRRTAGVNQLVSNIVGTVRIRSHLTDHDRVNPQRRPCSRLNVLRSPRLLWQTRPI